MEGAEGLAYDDPRSDSDAMVMGQMAPRGLHYHPTPRGMWSRICRVHQWTICCH